MFDQCWPTVYDVGPTSVKHWLNVSCLLGCFNVSPSATTLTQHQTSIITILYWCWLCESESGLLLYPPSEQFCPSNKKSFRRRSYRHFLPPRSRLLAAVRHYDKARYQKSTRGQTGGDTGQTSVRGLLVKHRAPLRLQAALRDNKEWPGCCSGYHSNTQRWPW